MKILEFAFIALFGTDEAELALEADDFDEAITQLKIGGAPFAMGPLDMPACRAAIMVDPDGNKLGIHKRNG